MLIKQKNTRTIGNKYERLAEQFLAKKQLKLVSKNFLCSLGEIDLIMLDKNTLVFIEVRFRKQKFFGHAAETVTPQKQQKIIRSAQIFLQKNPTFSHHSCRFDIIGIDQNQNETTTVNWIQNAFME
jgi:putative endonuclease